MNFFFYCFVILTKFIILAGAACPNIITRAQWGATTAMTKSLEVHPATHVVLHHSSTPTCNHPTNCAALVRSIQNIHMSRNNQRDIGYNFLIGEDGNVYEGVGWGKEATHTDGFNSRSIGICMIGDFTSWLPNEASQKVLTNLIECGVEQGHLNHRYKLVGHRQLENVQCPGLRLFHHMRGWLNWSASPNQFR